MDQLALAFTPPDIGHNHPREAIDPIDGLNVGLTATHADLVARFRDLELACGRVPDPIATEVDAAAATDFIARCHLQLKDAETARKQEKARFLRGGCAVDGLLQKALRAAQCRPCAHGGAAQGLSRPIRRGRTASV